MPPRRPAAQALTLLSLYTLTRVAGVIVIAATRAGQDVSWRRVFAPWDGPFYLAIVRHGYLDRVPAAGDGAHATAAFFPAYPMVARVLTWTGLPPVAAGVLLNLALGAVATWLFWRLSLAVLDEAAAWRAALVFVLMPGRVVFTLLMSDGLLVTLAVATLLALVKKRWVLAGVLAALAGATRPNAIGLVAACAVAAVVAWRQGDRRAVIAPVIAPLGTLGYWAWLGHHTGEAFAWFEIQSRFWHQRFDFGYKFALFLKNPVELAHNPTYVVTELGFVFLALALWSWWRGARIPPAPTAYSVVALAQMLLYSRVGPRARFLLAAFPLIWLVVQQLTGRWFSALLVVLVSCQLAVTWAFSAQYVIP